MQTKMLINGALVEGQGTPIDIQNPATGEVICTIKSASSQQVDEAVSSAEAAFADFGRMSPR